MGTPVEYNGIIVDKYLIDNWPEEFSGCWIGLIESKEKSVAYLVHNPFFKEGTVNEISERPEDDIIALITWDDQYRYTHLFVNPAYRDNRIAWILAMWLRTWMAVNRNIKILPPDEKNTTYRMRMFVAKWNRIYKNTGY